MKIAVVGSRGFDDFKLFKKVMDEFLAKFDEVEFISGGSSGADQLAFEYAKENFLPIKIYFANWKRYKKLAGYKRNKQIWQEADLGIAFWDGKSKGTDHSFKLSKEFEKEIFVYNFVEEKFIEV